MREELKACVEALEESLIPLAATSETLTANGLWERAHLVSSVRERLDVTAAVARAALAAEGEGAQACPRCFGEKIFQPPAAEELCRCPTCAGNGTVRITERVEEGGE